jgi:hypothetical protein
MIEGLRSGTLADSDLQRRIARGEVIQQANDRPDREYPLIRWSQYGVVPTNEVAVTVHCSALAFFAMAPSRLLFPAMADRIFGSDVLDIGLGAELADALWHLHGAELRAQALMIGSGGA